MFICTHTHTHILIHNIYLSMHTHTHTHTHFLKKTQVLQSKQEENETLSTHYNLADTIFAKATVPCDGRVCLWLGANVMLEYTYDEAIELLSTSLSNAKERLVCVCVCVLCVCAIGRGELSLRMK